MKTTLLLVLFLLSSFALAGKPSIERFTSDGCSAFPDGTWRDCCFIHDISYWMGGTDVEKAKADETFKQCVNSKVTGLGYITYAGVYVGGTPKLPTSWRWGYGWPDGRGYKKLSAAEKKEAWDELDSSCYTTHDRRLIRQFLIKNKVPLKYHIFD